MRPRRLRRPAPCSPSRAAAGGLGVPPTSRAWRTAAGRAAQAPGRAPVPVVAGGGRVPGPGRPTPRPQTRVSMAAPAAGDRRGPARRSCCASPRSPAHRPRSLATSPRPQAAAAARRPRGRPLVGRGDRRLGAGARRRGAHPEHRGDAMRGLAGHRLRGPGTDFWFVGSGAASGSAAGSTSPTPSPRPRSRRRRRSTARTGAIDAPSARGRRRSRRAARRCSCSTRWPRTSRGSASTCSRQGRVAAARARPADPRARPRWAPTGCRRPRPRPGAVVVPGVPAAPGERRLQVVAPGRRPTRSCGSG